MPEDMSLGGWILFGLVIAYLLCGDSSKSNKQNRGGRDDRFHKRSDYW